MLAIHLFCIDLKQVEASSRRYQPINKVKLNQPIFHVTIFNHNQSGTIKIERYGKVSGVLKVILNTQTQKIDLQITANH